MNKINDSAQKGSLKLIVRRLRGDKRLLTGIHAGGKSATSSNATGLY